MLVTRSKGPTASSLKAPYLVALTLVTGLAACVPSGTLRWSLGDEGDLGRGGVDSSIDVAPDGETVIVMHELHDDEGVARVLRVLDGDGNPRWERRTESGTERSYTAFMLTPTNEIWVACTTSAGALCIERVSLDGSSLGMTEFTELSGAPAMRFFDWGAEKAHLAGFDFDTYTGLSLIIADVAANGTIEGVREYPELEIPLDIAFQANGEAYGLFATSGENGEGVMLVSLQSDGSYAMLVEFDDVFAKPADGALALDEELGALYVTYGALSRESDITTKRLSLAGEQRWEARYDGLANRSDAPRGLAAIPGAGVVVVGAVTDRIGNLDRDGWVGVYNADGELSWEMLVDNDGLQKTQDRLSGVAVDEHGDVFVIGELAIQDGLGLTWVGRFAG